MEYFSYLQMDGTESGQKMYLGEGKHVYIEKFKEEEKVNDLSGHF
ncbi:hypothetical protein [Desulfopila sp. IMCC35006]|nr:hypothetical protein [Desulfopila sp. IMCC35006]